ncbi:MAG TPA: ABC transporter permease [Fibrobacteria bacterium]|nr:ABC transporter permease [Fibrobacteria bacterium]
MDFLEAASTLPSRVLSGIGAAWSRSRPGRVAHLLLQVLASPFRGKRVTARQIGEIFLQQMYFTAVEAVPIVVVLATLVGGVTLIEFATVLPRVGNSSFLGDVMVLVILRELGPLFTAFLVAGRTGSALATFIGNMKVHGEVDALESMGIDPVRFLVLPAVLGSTIGMICLSLLFTASAIFGGFMVAQFLAWAFPGSLGLDMDLASFLEHTGAAIKLLDVVVMIAKPFSFGMAIALLACLNGLALGKSSHEVPQGTRSAVVDAIVVVVVLDGIFAALFVLPQVGVYIP